ncbi:NACHT domain-containing protein [Streptomyces mirabilis]|uniref:NACHT domain-containing protein n=1 Tax=Streptomyces mirabilis TaxID=68239 RepID=UPI0033A780F5
MSALQKQSVLQELAYQMMRARVRDVAIREACAWIEEPLSRVAPSVTPRNFLDHVEQSSGLLLETESNLYSFAHLTFQEYLAAVYIKEERLESELVDNLRDSWWRETILLYAAQADATSLVNACLQDTEDLTLLSLAVQCSEEGREISLSARHALSTFLAGSVRERPDRRKATAGVKLFQRSRGFSRFAEDEYVSMSPVSCLEYQLFIDEGSDGESSVPDHWSGELYGEDCESDPIAGIRPSDAAHFGEWVQRLYADQWSYGLLSDEQIEDNVILSKLRLNGLGAIAVVSAQSGEPNFRKVPNFVPDPQILVAQLVRDMQDTAFVEYDHGPSHIFDDAGFEIAGQLTRERLRALWDDPFKEPSAHLLDAWRSIEALDLGWVRRKVEAINQGVLSFAYDEYPKEPKNYELISLPLLKPWVMQWLSAIPAQSLLPTEQAIVTRDSVAG